MISSPSNRKSNRKWQVCKGAIIFTSSFPLVVCLSFSGKCWLLFPPCLFFPFSFGENMFPSRNPLCLNPGRNFPLSLISPHTYKKRGKEWFSSLRQDLLCPYASCRLPKCLLKTTPSKSTMIWCNYLAECQPLREIVVLDDSQWLLFMLLLR